MMINMWQQSTWISILCLWSVVKFFAYMSCDYGTFQRSLVWVFVISQQIIFFICIKNFRRPHLSSRPAHTHTYNMTHAHTHIHTLTHNHTYKTHKHSHTCTPTHKRNQHLRSYIHIHIYTHIYYIYIILNLLKLAINNY